MIRVLIFIKTDADWDALHHFYVVAGSVLGGQQTEPGPGCATNRFNLAIKFPAVSVNFDLGRLSHLHSAELGFFEVGGGPDVIQVHDGKQRLARLHGLSRLDAAFAENAGYRRNNSCVLEIEFSLRQGRSGSLNFGGS